MERIQVVAIAASLLFLASVMMQIMKGKLREEYALVWMLSTCGLIVFSFWRSGLELLGQAFGVFAPLNLIFAGAIMAILIYLLHLSVAVSKLHYQNRVLSQELVLLREKLERKERTRVQEPIESAGEEPLLAPDGNDRG